MNDINEFLPDIKLRFNIEHPNIEDCYALGYECGLEAFDESINPFPKDSLESEYWQEGWWAGFYGEEPLFELTDYLDHHKNMATKQADIVPLASNDEKFQEQEYGFFRKMWEITGVIAVSALVGYQVIDLVA